MTPLIQQERDLSQAIAKMRDLQTRVVSDSIFGYRILVRATEHIDEEHFGVTLNLHEYFSGEVTA